MQYSDAGSNENGPGEVTDHPAIASRDDHTVRAQGPTPVYLFCHRRQFLADFGW